MSEVIDNRDEDRFELRSGDHVAELTYRLRDGELVLVHTGVPDELEGHGVGGSLVEAAVERARRDGLTIVPRCSFARRWLEKHADAVEDLDIHW
jgi:uncharacterized protein